MQARALGRVLAVAVSAAVALGLSQAASAAKRPAKPPTAQGSFTDFLGSFDSSRWQKADGWTNGPPFDNAWSADHVVFHDGLLELVLDDTAQRGEPYTSGEYRTTGYYGYGCYEVSMKPAARSGVITSFFTFAGPYDNGGNGQHNEIDIEFVGEDGGGGISWVQFNYWTNDDAYASRNEIPYPLGFDASADFHRYGFRWTSSGIEWWVDGQPVVSATNATPKESDSLQKIAMNLWPVDSTASGWAGPFEYPGEPLRAQYQWVRYEKGESCTMGATVNDPGPPPPPSGDASRLHVQDIALELAARGTQVIARVSVADGFGQPVAGAAVSGSWSGVITSGDTLRDTDGSGVATFYSSRNRSTGDVQFCVTGASLTGRSYDDASNVETCSTIVK
jgi:beta-glucanase (GH16 family)